MNVPQHMHDSMEFSLFSQKNSAEKTAKSNKNIKNYFKKQNELKEQKEASIAKFMEEVIPKR